MARDHRVMNDESLEKATFLCMFTDLQSSFRLPEKIKNKNL